MTIREFSAQANHQVLPHGTDKMVLSDCGTGQAIVVAFRNDGTWTVSAPAGGADPVSAATRAQAVHEMIEMALALGPETGYSTFEPYFELDGEVVKLRDLP